ncbi:MAG: DUF547 domain-containing protein [Gemmatimonadota bacterium]
MRALRLALLLLAISSPPASGQTEPAAAYSDWGGVLSRYVVGDHVQYARWKSENPAAWRRFLAWLEDADPSNLPADEQRAFWINAYNARVVAGVLAQLPLESIKDVGYLGGRFRGFFEREQHLVAGRLRSLDEMRAMATQPPLGDPRSHFALTMAAESAPPLRPEPYRGATLDTQLDFQTRAFLNGASGHLVDKEGRRLLLTPILNWYADDFERAEGSVRAFARKFLMGEAAEAASNEAWRIEWLDFDWRLDQEY